MNDAGKALRIVWLILSVAGACLVIAPMIFGNALAGLVPPCPSRFARSSCIACGMTTAFLAIGSGKLAEAQCSNAASIVLYSALAGNALLAAAYSINQWIARRIPDADS